MANFKLHENHNSRLETSVNMVAVGLRQLRSPAELDPFQLGNCIGSLATPIQNNADFSNFWSLARDLSTSLDDRVRNDYSKFFKVDASFSLDMFKELMLHMTVSNVGIVDISSYECFSSSSSSSTARDFVIEDMFTCVNSFPSSDKFLCVVFLCTVDGKLCCSLGYNSYFLSPELAREFADVFQEILNNLLID